MGCSRIRLALKRMVIHSWIPILTSFLVLSCFGVLVNEHFAEHQSTHGHMYLRSLAAIHTHTHELPTPEEGHHSDPADISQSPWKATQNLAAGLALLGVLFMAMGLRLGGWHSKGGVGVMILGIAGFLAGLLLIINAQNSQTEYPLLSNPFPPNLESLQEGKSLYVQHCQSCHGQSGRGDGPAAAALTPVPADLVAHVPSHPDWDLFRLIQNGISGTSMRPYHDVLTVNEIWHVVNYIKTFEE